MSLCHTFVWNWYRCPDCNRFLNGRQSSGSCRSGLWATHEVLFVHIDHSRLSAWKRQPVPCPCPLCCGGVVGIDKTEVGPAKGCLSLRHLLRAVACGLPAALSSRDGQRAPSACEHSPCVLPCHCPSNWKLIKIYVMKWVEAKQKKVEVFGENATLRLDQVCLSRSKASVTLNVVVPDAPPTTTIILPERPQVGPALKVKES